MTTDQLDLLDLIPAGHSDRPGPSDREVLAWSCISAPWIVDRAVHDGDVTTWLQPWLVSTRSATVGAGRHTEIDRAGLHLMSWPGAAPRTIGWPTVWRLLRDGATPARVAALQAALAAAKADEDPADGNHEAARRRIADSTRAARAAADAIVADRDPS